MQEGMIADITIFNPDTIAETATMKAGIAVRIPRGSPHVIVSGQIIIDNGVANTRLRAGKPIRYCVIKDGEIDLDLDDKPFQWHSDLEKGDFSPTNAPEPKSEDSAAARSQLIRSQAAKLAAANAWGDGNHDDANKGGFISKPCLNLCCVSGMDYPLNHPKLRPYADQLVAQRSAIDAPGNSSTCQPSLVASYSIRARALGYCCEWHMVKARFDGAQEKSDDQPRP